MALQISSHQPLSGNRMGFTVLNERDEPAFSIVCANEELHDQKLKDFTRLMEDAELIFARGK